MKQFNGNNNLWNDNIENQWEACWNHRNESNMENAQWLLNIIYNHTYDNRNTEIIRTGGDSIFVECCFAIAKMNPFIGYESVKTGMRLYCMIHDEIGMNEFIEFIHKIHPNQIMPNI